MKLCADGIESRFQSTLIIFFFHSVSASGMSATPTAPATAQTTVIPVPRTLVPCYIGMDSSSCPSSCGVGLFCNGRACVPRSECPCDVDGRKVILVRDGSRGQKPFVRCPRKLQSTKLTASLQNIFPFFQFISSIIAPFHCTHLTNNVYSVYSYVYIVDICVYSVRTYRVYMCM